MPGLKTTSQKVGLMSRRAVAQSVPAVHAKHPRIDQHVRGHIVSGKWLPGMQIPTYDKLEEMFSVSRVTVMEAIARLKHDGFLISGGPRGVFVAEHPPHIHNVGLVFLDDPQNPGSWSLFSHYVLEAAKQVMTGRPGRIITYHGVRNYESNEGRQLLIADLKAHRLGNLLMVHTGKDLMNTPIMKQKGVARAMIASTQPVPDVPSLYHDPLGFIDQSLTTLKQSGVKRIGLIIGGDNSPQGPEPTRWKERIAAHGLITHDRWIHHSPLKPQGWINHVIQAMLAASPEKRPDGLIISDDHFVEAATQGVKASGINVPDQLQIIAYTNFPWPTQAVVPVTRIGLDVRDLVKRSFEILDAQRQGQSCPQIVLLPVMSEEK